MSKLLKVEINVFAEDWVWYGTLDEESLTKLCAYADELSDQANENPKRKLAHIQNQVTLGKIKELEALKTANGYHEGDWMESIKQRIAALQAELGGQDNGV